MEWLCFILDLEQAADTGMLAWASPLPPVCSEQPSPQEPAGPEWISLTFCKSQGVHSWQASLLQHATALSEACVQWVSAVLISWLKT